MARVVLIAGGNEGTAAEMEQRLERARRMTEEKIGRIERASGLHRSAPWGFEAGGEFTNQVLVVETELSPRQVLEAVHRIENGLGRDRTAEAAERQRTGQRYASRPIDIDILFYDDETIDEPDLQIPHPRIAEREFVLAPLRELGMCKV